MNERVLEIVNILIKLILEGDTPPDQTSIVQALLAKGYEPEEIGAAFELIFSQKSPQPGEGSKSTSGEPPRPNRVLNVTERQRLSLEAWGFLEYAYRSGLLLPEELEAVLLYVSQADELGVGIPEVFWLIQRIVHDPDRLRMMSGGYFPKSNRKRRRRRLH